MPVNILLYYSYFFQISLKNRIKFKQLKYIIFQNVYKSQANILTLTGKIAVDIRIVFNFVLYDTTRYRKNKYFNLSELLDLSRNLIYAYTYDGQFPNKFSFFSNAISSDDAKSTFVVNKLN